MRYVLRPLAAALLLLSAAWACAAPAATRIYVCTDAHGKRLTSDRPIPECLEREQRVLNPDGSTRESLPPPLTAAERAAKEVRDRDAAVQELARVDAARVDRFLLNRYPDEATHRRARENTLNAVQQASELSKRRMTELDSERKAALAEAEFYKSAPMPAKLRAQIDANEAATASQRALIQGQETEAARINARFDNELERLRKLWAGAAPGSLGPMRPAAAASAALTAR